MRIILCAIVALLAVLGTDLHAAAIVTTHASPAHGGTLIVVGKLLGLAVFGATLQSNALTLLDWAKRLDPDGKVAAIVEILAQQNEILLDMIWREGNMTTGHRSTIRTGLPTVYWRMINQGIPPSKSTTAQVDDQTGMLEAWSEVDVKLAKLNGDVGAFRLSEAKAFLEAMNQEMAGTILYGNGGLAAEEFTGIMPRYSAISGAANADNIIDAGGTGSDNTSILLVAWGEETVFGVFPKGSKAGIQHEDFGEQTIEVTNGIAGNRMRALQERYTWDGGLVVKDWRFIVRIANIDVSDLAGGSPADLIDAMEAAEEILPNGMGKRVFYMNRRVRRYLRKQLRTDVSAGGGSTYDNVTGRPALMFGDTPVRRLDQLLLTESRVV